MNLQEIKEDEKSFASNIESAGSRESHESGREASLEKKEQDVIKASEILEAPPDGSFIHGLSLFVAWVKSLVAKDD